MWPLF